MTAKPSPVSLTPRQQPRSPPPVFVQLRPLAGARGRGLGRVISAQIRRPPQKRERKGFARGPTRGPGPSSSRPSLGLPAPTPALPPGALGRSSCPLPPRPLSCSPRAFSVASPLAASPFPAPSPLSLLPVYLAALSSPFALSVSSLSCSLPLPACLSASPFSLLSLPFLPLPSGLPSLSRSE